MLGGGARRVRPPRPPRAGAVILRNPRLVSRLARAGFRAARIAIVISPELLEILACPKCKQKVELSEDGQALLCQTDRLRYPIVDGIPVMLIEEATSF